MRITWRQRLYLLLGVVVYTLPRIVIVAIRMLLGIVVMMPGFVRMGWYYLVVVGRNRRSYTYGHDSWRQTVDVYQPKAPIPTPTPTSTISPSALSSPQQQQQQLQLHEHQPHRPPLGIIVFVPGGAWMIGYKMWVALAARIWTAAGLMVIAVDTRQAPFATVPQQVHDLELAMTWIVQHQGDLIGVQKSTTDQTASIETSALPIQPKIFLVGESAGGHLGMMLLLRQAMREQQQQQRQHHDDDDVGGNNNGLQDDHGCTNDNNTNNNNNNPSHAALDDPLIKLTLQSPPPPPESMNSLDTIGFTLNDIDGFVSMAAPYDLEDIQTSLNGFGFFRLLADRMIFGSPEQRLAYSPMHILQQQQQSQQQDLLPATSNTGGDPVESLPSSSFESGWLLSLPPIWIVHGTADTTVPYKQRVAFARVLQEQIQFHQNQEQQDRSLYQYDMHSSSSVAIVNFISYPDAYHTRANLQGPMIGDTIFQKHVWDWMWQCPAEATTATTTTKTTTSTSAVGRNEQISTTNHNSIDMNMPTNDQHDCRFALQTAQEDGHEYVVSTTVQSQNQLVSLTWLEPHDRPVLKRLCPSWMVQLGTWIMPF